MRAVVLSAFIGAALGARACNSPVVAGTLQVKVDGEPTEVHMIDSSRSNNVHVSENKVTIPHGARVYLGDKCFSAMGPSMIWKQTI